MKHSSAPGMVLFVWLATIASSAGLPALANDRIDLWGGVVFFCGPPIPEQRWGAEACAIAQQAAEDQAKTFGLPIVAVPADRAGLAGGPTTGQAEFDWGNALRLMVRFDRTQSESYPWSMTIQVYDHPADADGARLESRFRTVSRQDATLVDGSELEGTRDVAPLLVGGLLEQLFKEK